VNSTGKYYGMWANDVKDGFGVFVTKAYTYYGLWKNDKKEVGTQIFPDGSTYTGQFVNDQPSGQGTIEFSNGDSLFGAWKGETLKEAKFKKGSFESSSKVSIHQLTQKMKEIDPLRISFGGEKFLSGFTTKRDYSRDTKKFESLFEKHKMSFSDLAKKFDALHSDRGVWPLIYQHSEPNGLLYEMFDIFFYVTKTNYASCTKLNRSHTASMMDDILTFVENMTLRFYETLGKWKKSVPYSNLYFHVKGVVLENFWEPLFDFYKKANQDYERELKYKILSMGTCTLKDFGVATKFIGTSSTPYQKAVEKLREAMKRTQLDDIMRGLEQSNAEILLEINSITQKGGYGAEDILPISFYVFFMAQLDNSCGFTQLLLDLYDDQISQKEEWLRVTNLNQVLDFVMMLEPDLRDQSGCFVPFEILTNRIENFLVNNQYATTPLELEWIQELFIEIAACKHDLVNEFVCDSTRHVNQGNRTMVEKILGSVGISMNSEVEFNAIRFKYIYSRQVYLRLAKHIAKFYN
jgi:hypothetical protein